LRPPLFGCIECSLRILQLKKVFICNIFFILDKFREEIYVYQRIIKMMEGG
jgi:hypothetical protein